MSSCMENLEADDGSCMMLPSVVSGDGGIVLSCAFSDASSLVRWCFSHNLGAIKQLVGRRRTDLDATVSCCHCCFVAIIGSGMF